MIELKKKLALSGTMKNVVKISGGTMLGQVISFISLTFIARIYGAKIIGTWTLINSIAIIVNSFSDLGMTNAIMIEDDEKTSLRLYKVVTTIVAGISIISGMVLLGYYLIFSNDTGINCLFLGIMMMVWIFTLQQTQICYTWLNRQGKYNILMKNPVINNVVIAVVAITLGLVGLKSYGYYLATILGQLITLMHMKRFLPKNMFTFKKEDYKNVFNKRKSFIKYQMPTNVISQVKNQLPVLLIERFFGKELLGFYSVSVKVLNIPVSLLANAIGRVFFQRISEMKRKGEEIGEFVYRNILKAMKITIVPMILLVAVGDLVIEVLYGQDYEMAGRMLQIVSFQSFFTFLMMSSQGITVTLNKQNYAMISSVAQSIGYIVSIGIGKFIFKDIIIALVFMSIIYSVVQVIYFCCLFRVMNIRWQKYLIKVTTTVSVILIGAVLMRAIGSGLLSLL